jgi:hypothetical protein
MAQGRTGDGCRSNLIIPATLVAVRGLPRRFAPWFPGECASGWKGLKPPYPPAVDFRSSALKFLPASSL